MMDKSPEMLTYTVLLATIFILHTNVYKKVRFLPKPLTELFISADTDLSDINYFPTVFHINFTI